MKALAVIPARYQSTRFPGKPLARICGQSLLSRVVNRVHQCRELDEVIVATDNEEIFAEAKRAGARAEMTESSLPSGSDRVWAVACMHPEFETILNIQGDEPLVQPEWVDRIVRALKKSDRLEMATLSHEMNNDDLKRRDAVKVICNSEREAIYFSRFPIPYSREESPSEGDLICEKHVGLYGYQRRFLEQYCLTEPVPLERAESLEQLRALYLGARIRVLSVEGPCWGVDSPEDVKKIEELLMREEG